MSDLKNQLIRLGAEKPNLRKHIRPVLSEISKVGYYGVKVRREAFVDVSRDRAQIHLFLVLVPTKVRSADSLKSDIEEAIKELEYNIHKVIKVGNDPDVTDYDYGLTLHDPTGGGKAIELTKRLEIRHTADDLMAFEDRLTELVPGRFRMR